VFRGGITGSRGHEGDNAGESAIIGLTQGRDPQGGTQVFGCALSSTLEAAEHTGDRL
jgi:hypothetical protein